MFPNVNLGHMGLVQMTDHLCIIMIIMYIVVLGYIGYYAICLGLRVSERLPGDESIVFSIPIGLPIPGHRRRPWMRHSSWLRGNCLWLIWKWEEIKCWLRAFKVLWVLKKMKKKNRFPTRILILSIFATENHCWPGRHFKIRKQSQHRKIKTTKKYFSVD